MATEDIKYTYTLTLTLVVSVIESANIATDQSV